MSVSAQQVTVLSNRGPYSVTEVDGELRLGAGVGGLASALAPLASKPGVTWVSAANSAAEERAATERRFDDVVHFVKIDSDLYHRYYDDIANSTLWFVHHGMYDRVGGRAFDADWHRSWDSYRAVNKLFAKTAARSAPAGSLVLVQDYHLALVGPTLRRDRPDLTICHFSHTPFGSPSDFEVLPSAVARELLEAMACYDLCGFHCVAWEDAYLASSLDMIGECSKTLVAPLGPDADALMSRVEGSGCRAYGEALDTLVADRKLIVRVDRLEPAKNLVRGFQAFDELLASEPRWREQVVFVALVNPSRETSAEYASYRRAVEQVVAEINGRWATASWTPVVLTIGNSLDRSFAALERYDVLLVNSVRDGLNLVAKEGPLLNRRDGVLVLSRNTGAWESMSNGALEVNPFDVFQTRLALARALDMGQRERGARAAMNRLGASLFDWSSWLAEHFRALGSVREDPTASGGGEGARTARDGSLRPTSTPPMGNRGAEDGPHHHDGAVGRARGTGGVRHNRVLSQHLDL